ncbi:MAG: ethanolamine utilization protein EutJ [Actinomycetota bacterium]
MRPDLETVLAAADATIGRGEVREPRGGVRVGVDLGTATTVVVAVDDDGLPVAGATRPAEVVRDGVVVDFVGARELVAELRAEVSARLGLPLESAAACYPPGVGTGEVQAVRYVVEGAGMACSALVDEPTAANAVLGLTDGAVVDVGGGTTGTAILRDGEVRATLDEPTGGTHLTLVIAGACGITIEEAERRKTDPAEQQRLLGVVRPVLEKIGTIVAGHLGGHRVEAVDLVGGTSAFPGIAEIVGAACGVPARVPGNPLFVTPLGVARFDGAALPVTAKASP